MLLRPFFKLDSKTNLSLDEPIDKFAYNNTDWKMFIYNLTIDPFAPFCYSNVDFLQEQFNTRLRNETRENIQLAIKHRASLQPWISNGTSHIKNKQRVENLISVSK